MLSSNCVSHRMRLANVLSAKLSQPLGSFTTTDKKMSTDFLPASKTPVYK